MDERLMQHGWFVTGRVVASFFSDEFFFEEPNVRRKTSQLYLARQLVFGSEKM